MIHSIHQQPDGRYSIVYTNGEGRRVTQTDFTIVDDVGITVSGSGIYLSMVAKSSAEPVRGD